MENDNMNTQRTMHTNSNNKKNHLGLSTTDASGLTRSAWGSTSVKGLIRQTPDTWKFECLEEQAPKNPPVMDRFERIRKQVSSPLRTHDKCKKDTSLDISQYTKPKKVFASSDMMGKKEAQDKSVHQVTMEATTVNQSGKCEFRPGHKRRKGMNGHTYKALIKNKRTRMTAEDDDEDIERSKKLPQVRNRSKGVSGPNHMEDGVKVLKEGGKVEENSDDVERAVNFSRPVSRTPEVGTFKLGVHNLAGSVSVGKSLDGVTDLSIDDQTLTLNRKIHTMVRDTVASTIVSCDAVAISSPSYGGKRHDFDKTCVAHEKRKGDDCDKEAHCSSDGMNTRDLIPNEFGYFDNSLADESEKGMIWKQVHALVPKIGEKKTENFVKHVQSCCEYRMTRLVEEQCKDVQEFHRSWEQKRLILERGHKLTSAHICSKYGHPMSIDKLKMLDNEFSKKMEEYKRQREMSLKDLKEKQFAKRNEERRKAAHWLAEAKSSASGERVHLELRLHQSQNGNQVEDSEARGNGAQDCPENVVPEARVSMEKHSPDDAPGVSGTSPNGTKGFNTPTEFSPVVSYPCFGIGWITKPLKRSLDDRVEQPKRLDDTTDASDSIVSTIPPDSKKNITDKNLACIRAEDIRCEVDGDVETGKLVIQAEEFMNKETDGGDGTGFRLPIAVQEQNDRANNSTSNNLSSIDEKCLVEASMLEEKIIRKGSVTLSNDYSENDCHDEGTDLIYSRELVKEPHFSKDCVAGAVSLNPLCVNVEIAEGPKNDRISTGKMQKLVDKIQRKCANRMRRLVQKHQEEIQAFNRLWEQKRIIMEKGFEVDSALHGSMHRCSARKEELDVLNREFDEKMKEYKHQKDLSLKDLEQKQFAEKSEENRKAAHWLSEAKSISCADIAHEEPPQVRNSEASEYRTLNRDQNIARLARDLIEEPDGIQNVIETVVSGTTSSSINNKSPTIVVNITSGNDAEIVSTKEASVSGVELPDRISDSVIVSDYVISSGNCVEERLAPDGVQVIVRAEAVPSNMLGDANYLAVTTMEETASKMDKGDAIHSNIPDFLGGSATSKKLKFPSPESDIVKFSHVKHEGPLVEPPKEPQPSLSMDLRATPVKFLPANELMKVPEAIRQTVVMLDMNPFDCSEMPLYKSMHNVERGLNETATCRIFAAETENVHQLTPRSPNAEVEETISLVKLSAARIGEPSNVRVGDSIEVIASMSPHHSSDKQNSDGKLLIGETEGAHMEQGVIGSTEEVVGAIEPIDRENPDMESSSKKFATGSNTGVAKENDGVNSSAPGNPCSSEQSMKIVSSPQPVVSPMCDLPLPHNSEVGNECFQPLASTVLRDENVRYSCSSLCESWMLTSPLYSVYHQNEMERMLIETKHLTKYHEDLNLRLESECTKEKEKMIAQIKSKYEAKLQDAEAAFLLSKKEINTKLDKVTRNKTLTEAFKCTHMNHRFHKHTAMQQASLGRGAVLTASVMHQLPSLQLVPKSSPEFVFSSIPTRTLAITSATPVAGNIRVSSDVRAPAPHIQPFRPPASLSPSNTASFPHRMPAQRAQSSLLVTPLSLPQASSRLPSPLQQTWSTNHSGLQSQHAQNTVPVTFVPPHSDSSQLLPQPPQLLSPFPAASSSLSLPLISPSDLRSSQFISRPPSSISSLLSQHTRSMPVNSPPLQTSQRPPSPPPPFTSVVDKSFRLLFSESTSRSKFNLSIDSPSVKPTINTSPTAISSINQPLWSSAWTTS